MLYYIHQRKGEIKMWDYLFYDDETGEEFFVECDTKEEAIETAKSLFDTPIYKAKFTPEEAEWYGLDTY